MRRLIKRVLLSNVVSFSQSLFNSFKSRVIGNSGVVEAESCAVTTLSNLDSKNLLQSATFVLAPSGYKSGVIYSQVPSNGNGDLTVTRATSATRVNSSGVIETVASGVPQLDYSLGGCPNFLFEPQRTNNLQNSNWAGAVAGTPGTPPTNWTLNQNGGSIALVSSIYGTLDGAQAIQFTTSSAREVFAQSFNTTANASYVFSIYIEAYSGTITLNSVFGEATGLTGTSKTYYYQDGTNLGNGVANISATGRYYIVYSNTVGGSILLRYGLGISNVSTGSITLSRPMFESGAGTSVAFATSYIPTTVGAIATRNATSFTRSNIYTNGLISASGFTWLFEIKNNLSIRGDQTDNTKFYGMFIGNSSTAPTSAICIYNDNTTALLKLGTISGTVTTPRYTTAAASIKVAITYDGTTLNAWVNGTKQISAISFSASLSAFEHLAAVNTDVLKYIAQMALWNTILPDSQCASLTS